MLEKLSDKISYASSGVDISRGNTFVERIKEHCRATHRPEVLSKLGGFAGLLRLPIQAYKNPILLAATDGVGTKLKLATLFNRHDTIGIDLVAMCANDILAQGGEPIAFLDYYACARLALDTAEEVVSGIAEGCKLANCSLIGGETAELPGLLHNDDYDIAGFCIGLADEEHLLGSERIEDGDVLIGLASSGLHSNGFSLVRKLLEHNNIRPDAHLSKTLLTPTHIYVKALLPLIHNRTIQALAHITGGGIPENLARVLPADKIAYIHKHSWQRPRIMEWIRQTGQVEEAEIQRVFNDGIGMIAVTRPSDSDAMLQSLAQTGIASWRIGEIATNKDRDAAQVCYV